MQINTNLTKWISIWNYRNCRKSYNWVFRSNLD